MADFTLTTGSDNVTGTTTNDTVYATAATLNSGDSLTGGAGTDVLALVGSGSFDIGLFATFTGFERITLDNNTTSLANLRLGSQPIEVDAAGYSSIQVSSPSNWNGSNIISGSSLNFQNPSAGYVYDLTSNTFSRVAISADSNVTLLINSADAAGVEHFEGSGQLATAESTLDLSHSMVYGFAVTSTNALGTTFTVRDAVTASQIAGGSGRTPSLPPASPSARISATPSSPPPRSRKSSTQWHLYAPPQNPNVFTLTTGSDTVIGTASNDTVNGTAATLNSGDSLTGGAGTDTLALYGSGTFRVDQLATFTGFENITLNNFTERHGRSFLGSQSVVVSGYGAGGASVPGSGAVTFQGGSGVNEVYSTSASNWNAGNSIDGGAS